MLICVRRVYFQSAKKVSLYLKATQKKQHIFNGGIEEPFNWFCLTSVLHDHFESLPKAVKPI